MSANKMLENLKTFLDSPKGQEAIANFKADRIFQKTRREHNKTRMKRFYHDQESFDSLMKRICDKHDEAYENRCRKKGYQPYPMQILDTMHDIAECEGMDCESLDGLTEDFHSYICSFMNWQFAVTHGQGSVLSIYHNRELLVRL